VASFPNDFHLRPAELEKARGGTECLVHPGQDLDLFCKCCQMVICIKCVLTKHKPHTTKDLHEAADEAKKQLEEDAARLQQAVDYMVGEVEAEKGEERALRGILEVNIHRRCDMLNNLAEQIRSQLLASLGNTCNIVQQEVTKQINDTESKLDQLLQLQQHVQQAVTSNKASQLLNVAKEMREGRGSAKAVDSQDGQAEVRHQTDLELHADR
jgi:hypothetical protein